MNEWSKVRAPTKGAAHAIGGYSAGCLEGGAALPLAGTGFRVARPERNRVFGHPILIALLRELGLETKKLRLPPLVIGDLSQPRGGPAPTGHASHQSGLDVDVWFLPPAGKTTVSMVDAARAQPVARFDAAIARLLELFASQTQVERLFVNPVLKRALCERAGDEPHRAWLHKVRPWWGHDDHFHVRLSCPPDSPACLAQAALPPGDGCGELDWWFNAKAQEDRAREHQSYSARVGAAATLPEGCGAVLAAP